jgi:hypothetical protein
MLNEGIAGRTPARAGGQRPALGIILLVAGTCGLAGCSRAHDGTILYANPINRMLGTEEPLTASVAPEAFPEPPPPVRQVPPAPRRSNLRLWDVRPVRPPFVSASTAASLLSCRNVTQPGGRVRVVCE